MKVFFNFLKLEREIKENPMDTVERIKPKTKAEAITDTTRNQIDVWGL